MLLQLLLFLFHPSVCFCLLLLHPGRPGWRSANRRLASALQVWIATATSNYLRQPLDSLPLGTTPTTDCMSNSMPVTGYMSGGTADACLLPRAHGRQPAALAGRKRPLDLAVGTAVLSPSPSEPGPLERGWGPPASNPHHAHSRITAAPRTPRPPTDFHSTTYARQTRQGPLRVLRTTCFDPTS
ncbi:hypothetical protein F5X68DRAFT_59615 [Plectosphaerella plurivora]|uniref:Secreted protein n=1 Tax=Plectosphaerella plurivora TaxID=936078 RepID=A0A9P8VJ28_9PEZI|nr:hypothetical protein F5X68DRAFT_59615 [Plectosphaerella plurivora]